LHYHRTQHTHPHKKKVSTRMRDARNHYPQIKHHTPPPKQGNNNQPRTVSEAPPPLQGGKPISGIPHSGRRDSGPVVSKPNSVSGNPITGVRLLETRTGSMFVVHQTPTHYRRRAIHRFAQDHRTPTVVGGPGSRGAP